MRAALVAAATAFALTVLTVTAGRAEERPLEWLVGDLHVHVSPPDPDGHSSLTVAKALARARRARLDFVALTPHRAHELFGEGDDAARETGQQVVTRLADEVLRASSTDEADAAPLLVLSGWEFTRETPGHLGILFADVGRLRELVPAKVARQALDAGALVTVNHPFFGPVASDVPLVQGIDTDRTWRPFADTAAAGAATFNAIEVWHERSALIERMHRVRAQELPETQMVRRALAAWDRVTVAERRRIVGVGGSDAHGLLPYTPYPLAAVSVQVASRDQEGLRAGLLEGRVTFGLRGGIEVRSFAATSDVKDESAGIGGSLRAKREVRLTWDGVARLFENGRDVGEFDGGATRALATPGGFSFWRIEKPGEQFSNMIYANLP